MNWLDLARIGEECPHATEASFTAAVRAKWERVAAYIYAMYQTPLSASGTAEMAPVIADHGGVMPYPTLARWCTKDGALIFYGSDRAVYVMEKGEMAKRALEPMRSTTEPTIHGDRALCDALLDESIRDAADAAFEKRAYKGRTGGKDYYEQGEADEASRTPIGSQPIGSRHATDAVIGEAARGKDNEPATGARTGDRVDSLASASPSLPSWPKREQPKTLYDVVVDARIAALEAKIASLEAENARLRAALRGLLDTGWHRDYGYMDPACDAPNGGECSCGLTNAKESARSALEAGR